MMKRIVERFEDRVRKSFVKKTYMKRMTKRLYLNKKTGI